jgi:Domain of unknown function (DUF6265)
VCTLNEDSLAERRPFACFHHGRCATMAAMAKSCHAALLAAFLAAAPIGGAQHAPATVVNSLDFLTGRWLSEQPTEVQEENWSPVIGNSMTGSFRIVKNGRPVFYEFWVVEVDASRPVLKLKHFNANLAGWEEKNAITKLPLLSTADGDAVFAEADGSVSLHYHRKRDTLTCTVHHVRNGKSDDETFKLTRVPGS